jgi:Ca-activated chloride channel family protein
MRFHSPHFLWLLLPLVLLFSWELARHTARTAQQWPKIARAWAGAFDVSLGAKHTTAETRPRLWLWIGLALGIVALARPQWGVAEEQVFDQSREVLIALDLSKSMLAQDVKPSRLERSKLLISSLLDSLKGERVGLVLFSGTAFLQSPMSGDYEILREFLPALNPDYLPEGGTNYQAMLETSIQAFGTSAADRYLIILSDGEANDEEWKGMVDSLKTKGIRVIGLGVGTAQGAFIPEADGSLVKDERGAVVLSRLESSTLQELAQVTGGAYADASGWVDLPALLQQTVEAGRKGQFSEKNTALFIERYQWFLAPSLIFLLISFWAEFPVRPRERALPLGRPKTGNPRSGTQATAAGVAAGLLGLMFLAAPARAPAEDNPKDSFAAPLTAAVTRLADKDGLEAKDYAELAQTTLTYGQRMNAAQQTAPEGVIRDALSAVDRGEQMDANAADWPKLRKDLEDLRRQQEQKKQDQKNQEQKNQQPKQDKQDQSKPDQNKKDQNKPDSNKKDQEKKDQDKSDQNQRGPQDQSPPKPGQPPQSGQNEKPFGDMKEPQKKPPPPTPSSGTKKVGGQKEQPQEMSADPELALPLQKLDQVKDQDSPAQLQQLMRGEPEKPVKKGKDW